MKNSFFLIIPNQKNNPDRLKFFEPSALKQWLMDLPTANPGLSTRLFHDFINELNSLQMEPQFRLDTMELLRPSFKTIENYLISGITKPGFPKVENEEKIYLFLIAIEKEFSIGYWIIVRELTKKNVGWFQSKSVAQAIQRVIKGLGSLVISHSLMYLPVPEWIWMDLHSLNKLCVKLKKETVKIQDDSCLLKTSTPLDSYKQIILLSLADTSSLLPREILQVYHFSERILSAIKISNRPVSNQKKQCIILQDEDRSPSFFEPERKTIGAAVLYIDLTKLNNTLNQQSKNIDETLLRFTSASTEDANTKKLSPQLFTQLRLKWSGERLAATAFFSDRTKRLFCIGLTASYNFQTATDLYPCANKEYSAEPISERFLNCKLTDDSTQLSIGTLVSFRKHDASLKKRSLGIICNITQNKTNNTLNFAMRAITPQAHPVTFLRLSTPDHTEPQKALIFGQKENGIEKSYLVVGVMILNDFDILRLYMNDENFPIILRDKKSIGFGYWQFECRRLEEKDLPHY